MLRQKEATDLTPGAGLRQAKDAGLHSGDKETAVAGERQGLVLGDLGTENAVPAGRTLPEAQGTVGTVGRQRSAVGGECHHRHATDMPIGTGIGKEEFAGRDVPALQ